MATLAKITLKSGNIRYRAILKRDGRQVASKNFTTKAAARAWATRLGTDPVHTPAQLVDRLLTTCRALGWSVQVDAPYKGTMVPRRLFRREPRVRSALIEVNRRLYLGNGTHPLRRSTDFDAVRRSIDALVRVAVELERRGAGLP